MHLLQAGIDPAVIALWLGHDSLTSTRIYVQADLAMKERALAKIKEPEGESIRYIPSDSLLAFLESL
jgi:integrase